MYIDVRLLSIITTTKDRDAKMKNANFFIYMIKGSLTAEVPFCFCSVVHIFTITFLNETKQPIPIEQRRRKYDQIKNGCVNVATSFLQNVLQLFLFSTTSLW